MPLKNSVKKTTLGREALLYGSCAEGNHRIFKCKICIGLQGGSLTFIFILFTETLKQAIFSIFWSCKNSDSGLAKFVAPNLIHISTRVAGTAGYLAPQYAIRGQVTKKADIYSSGVLVLEIVSGRCNANRCLPSKEHYGNDIRGVS
ncbi:putative non-specific serine/threonine protein kinase [Rosa chinensis]|uniref:Putative non-specific serine/threonine protein kinase n=1 Tax=Rosa chinensis TaxID=74649 RepID=A0A2P6S5L6_ROSCH|nr:putative non-specific serine/threonine protein kinase [Rosa chinensis]